MTSALLVCVQSPVLVQLVEPDSTATGAPFWLNTMNLLCGMLPLPRMRSITVTPAFLSALRFSKSASSIVSFVFRSTDCSLPRMTLRLFGLPWSVA